MQASWKCLIVPVVFFKIILINIAKGENAKSYQWLSGGEHNYVEMGKLMEMRRALFFRKSNTDADTPITVRSSSRKQGLAIDEQS